MTARPSTVKLRQEDAEAEAEFTALLWHGWQFSTVAQYHIGDTSDACEGCM